MNRMKWWLLVLSLVCHKITCKNHHVTPNSQSKGQNNRVEGNTANPGKSQGNGPREVREKCKDDISMNGKSKGVKDCMEDINGLLDTGNVDDTIEVMWNLKQILEETVETDTTSIHVGRLVAKVHRPKGPFKGLQISANENEAMSDETVTNSKVRVELPQELDVESNNTIVFCMLTWPETNGNLWRAQYNVYESRLVGLSVGGKNISGLQERVNITMTLTTAVNETQTPRCVFFNFSTKEYSSNGCQTVWERGWGNITCSCDHLTYFGILMVSTTLPEKDREIQTYITLIGCSLSLFGLVITVLLFITNRKVRADVSMKVHINLVIALILLNVHFLPSQVVAALSSTGACLYMALCLHYSLLATFSWMAVEGFHLYLLLVRVFNIYIRRYLLKLSVVGWVPCFIPVPGVPAVIVSLVVIIDRDAYGHVPLDSDNSNSTTICYIRNDTVKMVTTVGLFGLVFIFNIIMLGVTVRRVVGLRRSKEYGQSDCDRAKKDICTLLGVTILLGITWGLVFFSFGHLTVPGLYLFCILNSLQGFFIFLWFVMSLRKNKNSSPKTSSDAQSTNS
ncbi:adhesion G-protein coupled receptor G5 isoform X2 [Larimichthys crocea]|uniref:adhesion G-protein coupled receptor G5 isoform X2 n=1 Tax=Larimichthys crocea TaxID=215358 RepID=UPI000F5F690C|nr:adhesion G-protein coupled receptor G5 isoform X2 [Larimichthys crocea]